MNQLVFKKNLPTQLIKCYWLQKKQHPSLPYFGISLCHIMLGIKNWSIQRRRFKWLSSSFQLFTQICNGYRFFDNFFSPGPSVTESLGRWSVSHSHVSRSLFYIAPIVSYGPVWSSIVPYGPLMSSMVPYGPLWSPFGPLWSPMVLYGPLWFWMVPYGPVWLPMFLCCPLWSCRVSYCPL